MVVSTYMSSIDSTIINDAIAYAQELFCTNAGGHDAEHTMRVYRNTLRIAEAEPDCDVRIAALAALLHDVDDHKLFATVDNANARAFLESHELPQETIERICGIATKTDGLQRLKAKSCRTRTGWMLLALSERRELLPTAANTGGLWMIPSGTFMISCCISNH